MSDTVASLVWSTTPEIAATLKTLPLEIMPSLINAAFTLPYPQLSPLLALLSQSPTISPVVLAEEIISRTSHLTLSSSEFSPSETLEVFPPSVIEIQPGSVAAFPLKLSHADTYLGLPTDAGVDRRTCLVGDAAHTVHPMAGQGMNMGLGDVRALVGTLEKVVENGGDVGALFFFSLPGRSRTKSLIHSRPLMTNRIF
jgi:ubiquinone biosynthesis monooxygenase Coq6